MVIINGLDDIENYLGKEIGMSPWHKVTQEQINKFAEATGDFQWIHTDVERCKVESPFKTTIAHGYLTLSMAPHFMEQIFKVEKVSMGINYGLNKVRFSSHVPVNSNLRLRVKLTELLRKEYTAKMTLKLTFEIEGQEKAVCVAESLALLKA
ncbi:MaoC family dehydratase [Chondrinema litorale]|uniref:MaoC family dehydratase n=1 Tax=Chondrinema litorale TaxID=2994555 RepID=UPI002543DA48|nr:MaoC family dehydratase [Chondrinema litorale]UZR93667.1 MaoC family dehydratase [Chondrinema litorale]